MNKIITFIVPSRNNLEFLKLAYKSIRNLKTRHYILILNDASIDGTQDWLESLSDDKLIVHTNPGPERKGIVGMWDTGVEMAKTDIIFAFHADMVAGTNLDDNVLKHLVKGKVVCATRIEPPLHPPGPEKLIKDFGIEPEEFEEDNFVYYLTNIKRMHKDKTTEGIFAPWCMYKSDYLDVGGHDRLFAPQSREDSDLFNRFQLNGYKFIQSWDGLVYHFTSRGSRYNRHAGGDTGKDSPEWQQTNQKNMRNFIRKWGHMVKHDEYMKPIIPPKYDIGFVVHNINYDLLYTLEPWCSKIYIETDVPIIDYISNEQKNTSYNLQSKVWYMPENFDVKKMNDIIVEFNASQLTRENFQFITQIPEIIQDSGEIGAMEYDIFKITINKIKTYEKELIICKK